MGPGRSPVGMTIDVTHEDDRESRLSRASNLPTPQTVKVKRLERRLDAADDAMARRKWAIRGDACVSMRGASCHASSDRRRRRRGRCCCHGCGASR